MEDDEQLSGAEASLPLLKMQGGGLGTILCRAEATATIREIAVDEDYLPEGTELLGSTEVARRLGVARASVDTWRRAKKVLAFRKGVRNYVYPARQFGERAPVPGIDRVRAAFPDDETTWEWLVTPNPYTFGKEPIDVLKDEKVESVVLAAQGALDHQ